MKKNLFATLIVLLVVTVSVILYKSCATVHFVSPENKNIVLHSLAEIEIPLLADNWRIENVKEMPTGNILLDKGNNPISLDGSETIESANGWFTISSNNKRSFTIKLKENFDKLNPRKLTICINQNEKKDYVNVTQYAGKSYRVEKQIFSEIPDEREMFKGRQNTNKATFINKLDKGQWFSTKNLFSNLVISTEFKSDSYGAFEWMSDNDFEITMPGLKIDGIDHLWNKQCVYKEGVTTKPYINKSDTSDDENKSEILVPPHHKIHLTGEVSYCKRTISYIFIVVNNTTETKFEVSGTCTQIIPIGTTEIVSDEPL